MHDTMNGYTIVASANIEGSARVILVDRTAQQVPHRWVTAIAHIGGKEWMSGDYFDGTYAEAFAKFVKRAQESIG